MYMRNNGHNKYGKYNIDGLPPNYSGQYTNESLLDDFISEPEENIKSTGNLHNPKEMKEIPEEKKEAAESKESGETKEKREGGLFGNLFGGHNKDGKKGGLLSGLFNKGDNKDKDGGILSRIELEDLILIAVIFFLLKDGLEDDLILILAIILFSS